MSKAKSFSEEEIPYETLSDFGLTREMIEDLPMSVIDDITAGNVTPVLPIRVKADDDRSIRAKSAQGGLSVAGGCRCLTKELDMIAC